LNKRKESDIFKRTFVLIVVGGSVFKTEWLIKSDRRAADKPGKIMGNLADNMLVGLAYFAALLTEGSLIERSAKNVIDSIDPDIVSDIAP